VQEELGGGAAEAANYVGGKDRPGGEQREEKEETPAAMRLIGEGSARAKRPGAPTATWARHRSSCVPK